MKLYEIHAAILSLLDQLEPDPETGELPDSTDAVLERIDALQMEKHSILEYLAKLVLNLRAEISAASSGPLPKHCPLRVQSIQHSSSPYGSIRSEYSL